MSGKDQISGVPIESGKKKLVHLKVATMADGSDLCIAVHIVGGRRSGHRLLLVGNEHGDETLALDVFRKVVATIDPSDLSGDIIVIPVANPISFESQTYLTPIDQVDIHHVYPGNKDGRITDKIAYVIAHEVADKGVNSIITLHGAGTHSANLFTYVPMLTGPVGKNVEEMSKVFGLEILYFGPVRPNALVEYGAINHGSPGIRPEVGTDLGDVEKFIKIGVRGVKNIMKHFKMIPGDPVMPKRQLVIKDRTTFRASHGGIFHPEVGLEALNKTYPKGTVLGRIVSPYSFEELEEITVPYDEGIVFLVKGHSRVHPGDYLYHVGNMETSEQII